jgi:Ca2+-binding EF-hand superfamily protein
MFEDLIARIDDDGNGEIEYQEFLAHAVGKK